MVLAIVKLFTWRKVIKLTNWLEIHLVIENYFSKGNTIYQFLQRCLDSLRKEFHELRAVTADQLMYVKEDLIIPHHYSFYDFIVTKVKIETQAHRSYEILMLIWIPGSR